MQQLFSECFLQACFLSRTATRTAPYAWDIITQHYTYNIRCTVTDVISIILTGYKKQETCIIRYLFPASLILPNLLKVIFLFFYLKRLMILSTIRSIVPVSATSSIFLFILSATLSPTLFAILSVTSSLFLLFSLELSPDGFRMLLLC